MPSTENDRGKWWIGNADTDPLHSAENDARTRAVVAAVNLAEAWVEFWDAVKALGEATRVIPPG